MGMAGSPLTERRPTIAGCKHDRIPAEHPASPASPAPSKPAAKAPKAELQILQCATQADWEDWLHEHHDDSPGVWLKIAKKGADTPAVGYPDALDAAICYGWIDGQKRAHDDSFWLQRFTPRGPRSKWSQINCQKAAGLTDRGRMREAGLAQVKAAQADGRWEAAYEPQSRATVPDDLQQALDQNLAARDFFAMLTGARRYAFLYRLHNVSTPAKRAQRIADYIVLLSEHRTLN
jgi:uncharacterized protein YdeI (YjbR/CyaY-like superfamily)